MYSIMLTALPYRRARRSSEHELGWLRSVSNKTKPTTVDPAAYIASIEHDTRREDALTLLELMGRLSGFEAKMWGPTMVGFGRYHYKYDTGREGDWFKVGCSRRKANQVIYLMPGYENFDDELARLGKHKIGKSCLYINKLADVDLAVVEEMVRYTIDLLHENYETSPE